jgi:membrane-associated phospholipid phosphatase
MQAFRMAFRSESIRLSTRVMCSAGLGAFWALGYFSLGTRAQPSGTFDPSIALDALIPFAAWAVWPYLLGIAWIALPAALICSPLLFRQTAEAYVFVMVLCFVCFVLVPAEAAGLRGQASSIGSDALTAWAVRTLYAVDPGTNLLPSLHVSLATVAACALVRQYPAWRMIIWILLVVVITSVLVLKQHTIADAAAGLIVAFAAYCLAKRFNAHRHIAASR